ncbi:MAG: hypothetical protein U0T73_09940 [Chitinophagales bacterium]
MKRLLLAMILVLCALCGCRLLNHFHNDPLLESWKIVRVDAGDDPRIIEDQYDSLSVLWRDGFIHFYKNGQVTIFLHYFTAAGKWHRSGKNEIIVSSEKNQWTFYLDTVERHWATITFRDKQMGSKTLSLLLKVDPHFEDDDIDIMSPELNAWRIPSTHAESNLELKKRLTCHLKFLIAYYELTLRQKQGYFETWPLNSPLRFYQNGIGLADPSEESWKECYYNQENAEAAYDLLGKAVHSINAYPKTESFTEGYIQVLKEMQDYLEH